MNWHCFCKSGPQTVVCGGLLSPVVCLFSLNHTKWQMKIQHCPSFHHSSCCCCHIHFFEIPIPLLFIIHSDWIPAAIQNDFLYLVTNFPTAELPEGIWLISFTHCTTAMSFVSDMRKQWYQWPKELAVKIPVMDICNKWLYDDVYTDLLFLFLAPSTSSWYVLANCRDISEFSTSCHCC